VQFSAVLAPLFGEYVPLGQTLQTDTDVAPRNVEYVPGAQRSQRSLELRPDTDE
jgi:hypothetical protein